MILKAYKQIKTGVRRWLLRSTRSCRELVPLMSESMDRRLGFSEQLELRLHLLVCVWCVHYLKQIKFLRRLLSDEMQSCANIGGELDAAARKRINASILKNQ